MEGRRKGGLSCWRFGVWFSNMAASIELGSHVQKSHPLAQTCRKPSCKSLEIDICSDLQCALQQSPLLFLITPKASTRIFVSESVYCFLHFDVFKFTCIDSWEWNFDVQSEALHFFISSCGAVTKEWTLQTVCCQAQLVVPLKPCMAWTQIMEYLGPAVTDGLHSSHQLPGEWATHTLLEPGWGPVLARPGGQGAANQHWGTDRG